MSEKLSERLEALCAIKGRPFTVAERAESMILMSRAAAVLRAVEGATQADVHRHAHMGPIALVETDSLVGCRVALVPLDAAGSAKGVEGG